MAGKIIQVKPNELVYEEKVLNYKEATAINEAKIWYGSVVVDPGKETAAYSNGDFTTGLFVLQGHAEVYYGDNFESKFTVSKDDFITAPPTASYKIKNLSNQEQVVFVVGKNPEPVGKTKPEAKSLELTLKRFGELNFKTIQTQNMDRQSGVETADFWMGRVTGAPKSDSGAHHHGVAETAGFIYSGKTRIFYGEEYKDYVDMQPGEFLYVPPFVPHIERNVHEEPIVFITARNPSNIVVNLEDKLTEA